MFGPYMPIGAFSGADAESLLDSDGTAFLHYEPPSIFGQR